MKNKNILFLSGSLSLMMLIAIACSKDEAMVVNPPLPGTAASASFVEEFDTVGNLTKKGWVFKNNSFPIGQSGWRQGRYEATSKYGSSTPFIGYPAYSATNTPNDFVSCDATAGNDINTPTDISAWLISPQLPMRNGDSITFYTKAVDDSQFLLYLKDRMQVRANFIDGTSNIGGTATSVGSFVTLLRDINQGYVRNDPGGYPRVWTKIKIVLSGIPGDSIRNGRFAFRYFCLDSGLGGGSTGANTPSVVGIDSLAFGRK